MGGGFASGSVGSSGPQQATFVVMSMKTFSHQERDYADLDQTTGCLHEDGAYRRAATWSTERLSTINQFTHSYREVGMLLLYLAVGVCVFSGVAYTAEMDEDAGFDTIPACWWWGTVSMTTVGYGDVVPVTVAGKLAASGCILGGILVVALPITIIFNKFSHFYRRQKALEAAVRNSDREKAVDENGNGESQLSEDEGNETSDTGLSQK
ncbi:hypothetical protein NDU88_001878 [Pleurodeles waltl]|uniref:Ion transport domain-containing protein n=1 Tax=Pleurodeles waltl TaxID=8319 RepID=A0AAV7PA19_PLEWA|nr:hypothetical protein NDU88_001878 [Pleurodeles waltl]